MPKFDETGPMGNGPRTGWGMGPCAMSRGRGFGWKNFKSGPKFMHLTKKDELENLEDEALALEEELKAVKEKIEELKKII